MEERLCPSCEEPVIDKQPPCPLSCMSPKCKAYQKKPVVNIKEKPVIWIIGGPGSGKGTQCLKIRDKYGYTHISIGDILRDEVKRGSDMSRCLETVMARGGLVPNDIVINIIKAAIAKFEPTSEGFIIDGYPRERDQGIAFETIIAPVSAVLYLDVKRETLIKRLTQAAVGSERFDDTEKAIKLRVQTFYENNQLILDQYEKKVYRISAENSIEEIFKEIVKVLEPIAAAAKAARAAAASAPSSASPA